MPRVHHVKKARKDNPVAKKGEDYYWWQFAFRRKSYSKTPPRRSQLTMSSFLGQLYDLQDSFDQRFIDIDNIDGDIQQLIDELQQMGDECQDSLDNMPEHLQDTSDSGVMLTERIENMDSWISEIGSIDIEIDKELSKEEKEDRFEEIRQELYDTDQYF